MKISPRSLESLLAMNSEQLSQRVKMGDHLESPRRVEHFAFFRSRTAADEAADELRALGYEVELRRKGFTFHLEARIDSDIEPETADKFLVEMHSLIDSHGGIYDGWGGPVVLGEIT